MPPKKRHTKKRIQWANNAGKELRKEGTTHAKENYNRTPNVNKAAIVLRSLGLYSSIPNYQRRQTRKNWENEQEALRIQNEVERNYPRVNNGSINRWYEQFMNDNEWALSPRNDNSPFPGAMAPVRNHSGENEELGEPKNGGRRTRRKRRA